MTEHDGQIPGRSVLGWQVRLLLGLVVVMANVGGVAVVLVLVAFVLPRDDVADQIPVRIHNLGVLGIFLLIALPLGLYWGRRRFTVARRAKDPDRRARMIVLHGPSRIVQMLAVLWLSAVLLFGGLNLQYSGRLAFSVSATTAIGGITTCSLCYLLVERILRRSAARVLSGSPPRRRRFVTGVMLRSVGFWALGTAVPMIGLMLAGLVSLIYGDSTPTQLAVTMLAIGGTAVGAGLLTTVGAARAMSDPIVAVRRALARLQEGDLDVRVPVYDNTELGQLQAGFNTMVEGLRERERIRDLFGRHVGRDVAEAAAKRSEEIQLGGELRAIAVLFVDLTGSTAMATRRPPEEVVGVLNRFFGIVVECVENAGGWINKFEGDAALAVFGAPLDLPDPPTAALSAARRLAERLTAEMPEISAGIGVSAGDAVAGNVGDPRRFEYTVIGDPVNEAARLTDLAKTVPSGVVAAQRAVDAAAESETRHWEPGEPVVLRGRDEPTGTASPTPAAAHPGGSDRRSSTTPG